MKTLFYMSLYGSAMILMIIILRGLLKHRLPRSVFKTLWILAALRLLIPFFTVREISVPVKFYSPTKYIISENQELPAVQYTPANGRPDAGISINKSVPMSKIIFAVWVSGAAVMMSVFAALYFWGIKKYRSAKTAYNPEISKITGGLSVRKKVRIKISDEIFSPLTYGIIHPVILLPRSITDYEIEQITYVISHELIHIKNNDLLWKLLVIFALCLHWFNPLVWVMLFLFSKDTELSCDEEVIRRGADREAYALTLISFKEKQKVTVLSNSFGKNAVSERIESIMKFKKTTTAAVIAAIAVIGCTTAVFAAAPEIKITKEVTVSEPDTGTIHNSDNSSETIIENYDCGTASHPDKKVVIHLGKYGETLSTEYVDWDYEDSVAAPSAPVYEEEEEETVTFENGLEITLPPKANYGIIKSVPEEEYAYGEDAVKVLAEMFSDEESFTYPIDSKYNKSYIYHGGFNISAAKGENIYSMLDGTVIYADMANFPFGNAVIIDHGNGNVCIYAFCNDLCVSAGNEVKAGDIIAHVGSTGDTADNALYIYRYQ